MQAFTRAATPLTPAQLNTAYQCWKQSTCETGTGGKITLGIFDGGTATTWRSLTRMNTILQALTYPQIGKIIYTIGQGSLPTFLSNIRTLTSQGATALVGYDDFGTSADAAFTQAQNAGAKISTYVGGVPGAPVSAISNRVNANLCQTGVNMANTAAQVLNGHGQVAFFNGTAGNPQGKAWNTCASKQFQTTHPGLSVSFTANTDWTLPGTAQATSALIASGKSVGAILYDSAQLMTPVPTTYSEANKQTPTLITWTSSNQLFGQWQQGQKGAKPWKLFYTNALNWQSRISLTNVMDLLAGKSVPAQTTVPMPFVQAKMGDYKPNAPGDAPGPTALIPPVLLARMLTQ